MRLKYVFVCAVAILFAACAKEMSYVPKLSTKTVLVNGETTGEPAVRAVLNGDRNVVFSADDAISVFDGTANRKFTTTAGGATAAFSGEAADAATYYLLSPYQADASLSDGKITATIPAVQTAVKNGVDPAALVAVASAASLENVTLKNVVGLIKLEVTQANEVREIQIAGNAARNGAIAGKVIITPGDEPACALADTSPQGKVTCVTLVPPTGKEFLETGIYYAAVLSKDYDGMVIGYVTASNQLRGRSTSFTVPVKRSKVLNMGTIVAGASGYTLFNNNAIFPGGPDVLLIWKKLANPSVAAFHSDDNVITRIEVKTNSLDGGAGTNSHTGISPHPIHAILRDGVLTLYTRASKIQLAGGTGATNMFRSLKKLETVDFSNIVIGNCNTLQRMFRECSSLEEVDLSSLNTQNVTNMSEMFFQCAALKKVNLTGWKTTSVTSTANENGFAWMFMNATNIEELRLGDDFSIATGGNTKRMFEATSQAVSGRGDKCMLYCTEGFWTGLVAVCEPGNSTDPTTQFNKARFDISDNTWYVPEP